MGITRWQDITLRASAATSGANEQDAAVTLPADVTQFWAEFEKTAEANADNLLTIRLQAQVNGNWVDLPWQELVTSQSLSVVTDVNPNETRAHNVVTSDSNATFIHYALYKNLPSDVIRVASISSGTTPANTFSVVARVQRSLRR